MERDKRRVLIADVPELEGAWRSCLVAHEVTFACSLAQASEAAQARRQDLVVVGMHFDDSQMFGLLDELRGNVRRWPRVLVCVRAKPTALSAAGRKAVEEAVLWLGADAYIDATQHPGGLREVCRDLERMLAWSAGLHPASPLQPSKSRER